MPHRLVPNIILFSIVFLASVSEANDQFATEPMTIRLDRPRVEPAQPTHRIQLALRGSVYKAAIAGDGKRAFVQFLQRSEDNQRKTMKFVIIDLEKGVIERDLDWPEDVAEMPPVLNRLVVSENGKWLVGSADETSNPFGLQTIPERTRAWVWDVETGCVIADHQTPEAQWANWQPTGDPQWLGVVRMVSSSRQMQRKLAGEPIGPWFWFERWRLPDLKVELIGGEAAFGLEKAGEKGLWQPVGGLKLSSGRPTARAAMYVVLHEADGNEDSGMWLLEVEPDDPATVRLTRRRAWDLLGSPKLSPSGRWLVSQNSKPRRYLMELRDPVSNEIHYVIDPTAFGQWLHVRFLTDLELTVWSWSNVMQAVVVYSIDLEKQAVSQPLVIDRNTYEHISLKTSEVQYFSGDRVIIPIGDGLREPVQLLVFSLGDPLSE